MRTLGRLAEGVLEAGWLAAVTLVPLVVDKDTAQPFEPAKAGVLQCIAVLMLVAWIVKILCAPSAPTTEQGAHARVLAVVRLPLFWPVSVFVASVLIASAFSLSPHVSVWGHRGRAQGVATLLAEVAIFAATAANLSSRSALRRLLSALVLPSVPIALYALCQRLGFDPFLPTSATEVQRATSFLGQPVFLAAYLGMVCPFTALLLLEAFADGAHSRARRLSTLGAYGALLLLQLAALLVSESRGPLLGLVVASTVGLLAHAARRSARRGVLAIWLLAGIASALVALGLPAQLRNVSTDPEAARTAVRASEMFSVSGGGGQFRATSWKIAARAAAAPAPLELADGSHDSRHALRRFVGYGPELQYAISPPFYDTDSSVLFSYSLVDRFHNQLWDILLTTGMLGLAAWLTLSAMLSWQVLRTLGLLDTPRRARLFWSTYVGCAGVGAVGWSALYGLPFCFLGVQTGVVLGLALFLSAVAWSRTGVATPAAPGSLATPQVGLSIVALSVLTGHAIETSFSFVTISTGLLFWLVCALVVLCARGSLGASRQEEATHDALPETSAALCDAAVLAWPLTALGFAFLGASALRLRIGSVLWDGLTLLSRPAGGRAPVVLALVLSTWLVGALLLRLHRPAGALARHGARTLIVASGTAFVFWMMHASGLAERARRPVSSAADVTGDLASRYAATTTFYLSCLLIGLLFAAARTYSPQRRIPHTERPLSWWRAVIAVFCLLLSLPLIERLGLRPAHAETAIAAGQALSVKKHVVWAEQAFAQAIELQPGDDVYQALLAKTYMMHARLDSPHAAAWLERAQRAMRQAITTNPAASENATNLALINAEAAQFGAPAQQAEARASLTELYTRALRLHPLDPNLWRMWGRDQLSLLGEPDAALASAQRALPLDDKNAAVYALLADCQLAVAQRESGDARTESLSGAASAYERATTLAPNQPSYRVGSGKAYLELGQASKAADAFRLALARLPRTSRARQTTLLLLQRAESAVALSAAPAVTR